MPEMTEQQLRSIIDAKIKNAIGYQGGRLSQDRQRAERYYRGDPFGNEEEGQSQVVSRDVAEAIDSMMPSLMKIFTSGDEIVHFNPRAKADAPGDAPGAAFKRAEKEAKQATDYVNWIWHQANQDSFKTVYWWFKDALLKKLGVIKIWWEETSEEKTEEYEGLTEPEYQMLLAHPEVVVLEEGSYPDPATTAIQGTMGNMPVPMLHDCKIKLVSKDGRIRYKGVPSEEFLVDRRAVDEDEVPFIAHRVRQTLSDLIAMYPDKRDVIMGLPSDETLDPTSEKIERHREEDEYPYRETGNFDQSMREVWVVESYVRVDYDGDGISELRKVVTAGDTGEAGGVILFNEEEDDHPFAVLCPVLMPHKLFGNSVADQTMDLQLIKSTIWRQILNNLYVQNYPQIGALENQVNLDDLLNRRAGGVVRMKSPQALFPIPTQPLGAEPYNMIQYVDAVREQRTGVQRFTTGPGADALNSAYTDTATGANIVQNSSQERLELIARTFAETGVKRAMRRILELVCKHQQKPKIIQLRNEWVPMDPREWDAQMDMTVTVGLGTGNKTQQIGILNSLLMLDQQIVQFQGGAQGPLVSMKNIYAKLAKLIEAAGLKNVEAYYTDPDSPAGQQAQAQMANRPDPKMVEAQMKMQIEQQKAEHKAQLDQQSARQQMALDQQKALLEARLEWMQAQNRMQIEQMQAAMDARVHHMNAVVDLHKSQFENALKAHQVRLDHGLESERVRLEAERADKSEK